MINDCVLGGQISIRLLSLQLTITSNNYSIYKCHMPQEVTVLVIYGGTVLLIITWIVRLKLRSTGVLYTKVSKHLD